MTIDPNTDLAQFAQAQPFPHVVVDHPHLPVDLDDVLAECMEAEGSATAWRKYDGQHELKFEGGPRTWGPTTKALFHHLLNDADWLAHLEAVTGIEGLIGSTIGGGYHVIHEGGHLDVHVDFTRNPETGHYRRLNVLIYLNHDWTEADGGQLLLGANGEASVLPVMGRMVIFATSSTSWHGHPTPVAPGKVRRSVAAYYYTVDPGPDYAGEASTVWVGE